MDRLGSTCRSSHGVGCGTSFGRVCGLDWVCDDRGSWLIFVSRLRRDASSRLAGLGRDVRSGLAERASVVRGVPVGESMTKLRMKGWTGLPVPHPPAA